MRLRILFCNLLVTCFLSSDLIAMEAHSYVLPTRYYWDMEHKDTAACWINLSTIVEQNGNHFSRTDSLRPYGIGWQSQVPGANGHQTCQALVSLRIRSAGDNSSAKLVFVIEQRGKQVFWEGVGIVDPKRIVGTWYKVSTVKQVIPAEYTATDCSFKVFVWNDNGQSAVDIDDVEVEFLQEVEPSFMPSMPKSEKVALGQFRDLYKGPRFSLQYDKVNGAVQILSGEEKLFGDFMLCANHSGDDKKLKHYPWNGFLLFVGDSMSEDGHVYRFTFRSAGNNQLLVIVPNDGRSLDFRYRFIAGGKTNVQTHRLFFRSYLSVQEIYSNQGVLWDQDLAGEYWLGSGGVSWRTSSRQWMLYHPSSVSSIQFDASANIISVNVDDPADHPLLFWPMGTESKNQRTDRSSSLLSKGDSITCQFSLMSRENELPVPRFLDASYGREAVFIFTEHADYTTIRSNRAVYFGNDSVVKAKDAIGGFAGHHIPVTKSVFYANPDHVTVDERAGFATGEITSVSGSRDFEVLLKDLEESGCEIALHTPDHYSCSPGLLEESLRNMSSLFKLSTWIDHGYDNSPRSNREDLVCDGFVVGSLANVADRFKQYGIKNIWNCFYEDSSFYKDVTFNSELVTPHPAFGSSFPRNVHWNYLAVTGDLNHFRTTCTLAPKDPTMWDYLLSNERLDFLVASKDVHIVHCYPARIDSVNGFYNWRKDHWEVDAHFESALMRLERQRDSGRLWVTTIHDYVEYSTSKQSVRYMLDANGFVALYNPGVQEIKGVTFIVKDGDVSIPGKRVQKRMVGDELIFWFDLGPGETATIKTFIAH